MKGELQRILMTRNLPPSLDHLFGTDWLGRDMFTRTVMGLSLSIGVGLIGAIGSTSIALILGMAAATMGKMADRLISWLIDLFLSVPHLVTLILIAFTLGGGFKGIVIGLMLNPLAKSCSCHPSRSHANSFCRICSDFSEDGEIPLVDCCASYFSTFIPQILIGFMLLFPHVILHEAASYIFRFRVIAP